MRIIESGSIKVIDCGEISTEPSSPNVLLITAAGLLAGIIIAYIISFVKEMLDIAVKPGDNLTSLYGIPVFAEVMDYLATVPDKKKHYGGYSSYGYERSVPNRNLLIAASPAGSRMIPDGTSFAITEAYNTARTNIMFAASTSVKKIVAVTISNPSDGKSTTCAKIALSFANAGQNVLLVECDLRKPVVAKNFKIKPKYGLSSVLGGFCGIEEAICCQIYENLDIITAGDIPPNPSELLSSDSMKSFLNEVSVRYDYVFPDTPPVNVVTDSQLFNEQIAGLVVVIKEGTTTHPDIQSALDKIALAKGKTLGFIKTFCRPEKSGGYGKKYSYSKYGYKYGYSYSSDKIDEKHEKTS